MFGGSCRATGWGGLVGICLVNVRGRTLTTGISFSRGMTTWTVRVEYTSIRRAASSVPSPRGRRCAVGDLGRVKI